MRLGFRIALMCALFGCASDRDRDPSQWPLARLDLVRDIPTDDPAEATYRAHCTACHGVDGRGAGAETGADFTSPEGPLRRPDAELLVSIREGRHGTIGVMPAHGAMLGDERSAAVLTYVRSHFGPTIAIVPEPAVDSAALDGTEPAPL